jgi:hypothetical protein
MASPSVKTEDSIVLQQIETGERPALDDGSYLVAWFEQEYQRPALYIDEDGQG